MTNAPLMLVSQIMKKMSVEKYQAFAPIDLPNRTWPNQTITQAPIWCSVDLRDGNQALVNPMDAERKRRMFEELVAIGFKEIEVGFPAASQTDFDFVRSLIEEQLIPEDVTIQVLTQAREELIERTFESLKGARQAIVHLYNSTSALQRRVVFGLPQDGITKIAVDGATVVRELAQSMPETRWMYEYSPESFTGTELEYAVEVCTAVMEVYRPTPDNKMILNLPATVEMATPNIYADQIEWFGRNMPRRDCYFLSLHPHDDRGTGVAAAELGVMAGADRVEGTLFGNGERTGNVDVVNIALNLFTQGISPNLDFSDINRVKGVAEYCNQLPVHPRHPYVGDLAFTAFSGSHQDAIKKGMQAFRESNSQLWEVPYLPIDPDDVGRTYEDIVRINSQSGKGGVAYILQWEHKLNLPRKLQIEFSRIIQERTDRSGVEITSEEIWVAFREVYLESTTPFVFIEHTSTSVPGAHASERCRLTAQVSHLGKKKEIYGIGTGPIHAFVDAINQNCGTDIKIRDYIQHALGTGTNAEAVTYLETTNSSGTVVFGVGMDANVVNASLKAVVSAANRLSTL